MSMSNRQRYVELCLESEARPAKMRSPGSPNGSPGSPGAPLGSADRCFARVAELLGTTPADLRARTRSRRENFLRQQAVWLLDGLRFSSVEIGRLLERDHSTILHALGVARANYQADADLAHRLDELKRRAR